MMEPAKYSIITTCKGRLHHLVRSLPAMLRQSLCEVIVVDYACPDKTAQYVEQNHSQVRVVRVTDVAGFNASHARNCGARAAQGERFAFVDADIVLSDKFIPFLEQKLGANSFAKFPSPDDPSENSLQGTCVIHRRHFEQVGGYDEILRDYGGEDLELYERLRAARVEQVEFGPETVIEAIYNDQSERTRFFAKGKELGFLIGKIYRVAKLMMIRINASYDLDRETRQALYDEITRLVRNMDGMKRKELRLEIKLPDTGTRGLHRKWKFLRSIVVHVEPRES